MKWQIENETDVRNRHVAKLGQAEYDRRLSVAEKKADDLADWKEAMFMKPQFVSVAMQLNAEQFEKMSDLGSNRWSRLICKLAGV